MTTLTIFTISLLAAFGGLGLIYWLEGLMYKEPVNNNFNRDYKSSDERVFYRLSGEAVSITSGLSIVESALYQSNN